MCWKRICADRIDGSHGDDFQRLFLGPCRREDYDAGLQFQFKVGIRKMRDKY